MNYIFRYCIRLYLVFPYVIDKLLGFCYKHLMRSCGSHVYIRPLYSDIKGLHNLSIGNGTSIPKGSVFYCTEAPLIIGNKVLFGPRPTIITGDHRIDRLGEYIVDVNEKLPENDKMVTIEDDVWIGDGVIMTPGRIIKRGTIIAARCVLCKNFLLSEYFVLLRRTRTTFISC